MHDVGSTGNTSRSTVARRATSERHFDHETAGLPVELTAQRLESVVSELVARQAEAIVETISARILQRFFTEIRARERSAPAVILVDSDPIEKIPMATRAVTALHRIEVKTVGQLTALREDDLRKVRSIGEGSVTQLVRILALYGRRLAA
ncbi:MAG TPA: DNA-directed RNA polymerase subunit alpha C-terminal domain-containing protein [Chthoniobacter sp.]